jgi:hypothetical protein
MLSSAGTLLRRTRVLEARRKTFKSPFIWKNDHSKVRLFGKMTIPRLLRNSPISEWNPVEDILY